MSSAGRGIVLRQIDRLFREGTLGGLGDGQLLERYLTDHDEAAFEALVDLHGPMVLGLCRRMLRDPRDIEDAFQATFLVLVRKAPAIRDRGLLSSWLYGVAYRVARRARIQTLRRRGRETAVADLEVATAPESSDRWEVDAVLDQELSRLPEKYRAPLVLCYLKGQTHDQAAEQLRCPVGTVRSRLARGRDLLKKRLTRRGFAPTAAILGSGPTELARLLSATVPPSLVSATVQAALGFGSTSTIQAGAAALALAQGVLTTMKLAQLKWIGLAVFATSLSAGGVVAVSYAAGQTQEAATSPNSTSIRFDPQEQAKPDRKDEEIAHLAAKLKKTQNDHAREKARLTQIIRELRDKLERQSRTHTDPFDAIEMIGVLGTQSDPDLRRTNPTGGLEVRLKLALEAFDRREKLYENKAISTEAREEARGKVLLTAAQLEDLAVDLGDEIDRLKLEGRRKDAERRKAEAQQEAALTVTARKNRLNKRVPGTVGTEDVAKAEAEVKVASAQIEIAKVEAEEVALRIQQLQRRRHRIKRVISQADRARAAAPAK